LGGLCRYYTDTQLYMLVVIGQSINVHYKLDRYSK